MMKFGVLIGVLLISVCSGEFCYNDIEAACNSRPLTDGMMANCNAKYGGIDQLLVDLQKYANANIETSFEYLLMSTHFGNYGVNREGFKGLYRKLSDRAWDNAIDVIKFITKRGGKMNFNQAPRFEKNGKEHRVVEVSELSSLAKALDTEKQMAKEAIRINEQAGHHPKFDASVAHYMEEKFMESQAETVRTLSGHTNDLKTLLSDNDATLSVFLFDEYLKKTL
ncbi:uncharacterized protein LOC130668156 [Microplitis mediator]|uniref:uncharacterized protein LOC130668156 n=1 Tax=Microplitis mediator TaxID=375433 RepID=UPI002553A77C|nr:uncharacterized protein LOC130668156 [Microplitis mediator]XP_057326270.1 uncharacterized protein LOC130668156 [Microplitis mediator]